MSQVLVKFRRRPTKHGSVLVKQNRRFVKLKVLPTTVKMTSEWFIGLRQSLASYLVGYPGNLEQNDQEIIACH
uniref:Uncharacterized protein n=1 Tax=Candidatus Kentrum sp. UNK TaxID=2126344 RepID=A0A451ANK9_9GAMM|nr:MAG: hypothetical protein BECKUNK1418G_GA0071005_11502 [Candidatus Kentron sp. UNK]VFK72723.1 MAG: hypothetical protein BECKUNK1418H_GA0071006_11342 [Candidatus Kentron sp. UNK]